MSLLKVLLEDKHVLSLLELRSVHKVVDVSWIRDCLNYLQ